MLTAIIEGDKRWRPLEGYGERKLLLQPVIGVSDQYMTVIVLKRWGENDQAPTPIELVEMDTNYDFLGFWYAVRLLDALESITDDTYQAALMVALYRGSAPSHYHQILHEHLGTAHVVNILAAPVPEDLVVKLLYLVEAHPQLMIDFTSVHVCAELQLLCWRDVFTRLSIQPPPNCAEQAERERTLLAQYDDSLFAAARELGYSPASYWVTCVQDILLKIHERELASQYEKDILLGAALVRHMRNIRQTTPAHYIAEQTARWCQREFRRWQGFRALRSWGTYMDAFQTINEAMDI